MSIKLLQHNNLGNFESIKELLLGILTADEPKPFEDVKKYCLDKSIDFVYSVDGIVGLLSFIGWVAEYDDGLVLSKPKNQLSSVKSDVVFKQLIVEALFRKLKENGLLHRFMPLDAVKFDTANNTIALRSNNIPLEFSGLRNLLIEFEFLSVHDLMTNLLLVSPEFADFFEKKVIVWIKRENLRGVLADSLSYNQFISIQRVKEEYGEQAEDFVLLFEQARLKNHPDIGKIRIISKLDVSAGYDIVSFNSLQSKEADRFIEVKSYSGKISFYWSVNEVRIAQMKGTKYFLYLVDRQYIDDEDYEPLIIQDPYLRVFLSNAWNKDSQSWFIESSSQNR
ncbi:MAG: hypothetical protein DRJ03_18575 [Chloroflexi bacterium]|nr:MAG: hypothetical protein DRI81_09535 [Chloroflexota bacterium]RLC82708.1 MAG: hypothetical protein DRJ03_18575 [Chloroflexota bacterium]